MTRRLWQELRDEHLQTPEAQAAYQAAHVRLEAELAEYAGLSQALASHVDMGLGELRELRTRVQAARTAHPEWFDFEEPGYAEHHEPPPAEFLVDLDEVLAQRAAQE